MNESIFDKLDFGPFRSLLDNDDITDVFTGTIGKFGKCPYMDRNVDYFRILGGALELNISRIKGENQE